MSYTVLELINRSYYLSGIVARDFQTVSGSQASDALSFLNDILSETVVDIGMVPYYTKYTFNAIQQQETYFIPNLIKLDTLVFFISNVRYQMTEIQRRQYFGTSRANNIFSLPFTWHTERTVGGSNLYLYFQPDINYPMEAWGLFALTQVLINQDLETSTTRIDLGQVTITGTGTLIPSQFVINGIDFAGNYATPAALVLAVNTLLTNVNALMAGNQFILNSNVPITLSTVGNASSANTVTFQNFNTIAAQVNETYFPMQLERFYISYLKYALSVRLCNEFNYSVPPGIEKQLLMFKQQISKRSQQIDLRNTKISTLGQNTSLSYAQINLGQGWTAP